MKILLNIIVLVFLMSCTSNTIYDTPENLIPKDTMVFLLEDMYIANSAAYRKNIKLKKDANYMALVYNKYAIDSMRFQASSIYYTSRSEEYTDILKEVKRRLEVKKIAFEKKITHKDSISRGQIKKKSITPRKILEEFRSIQ